MFYLIGFFFLTALIIFFAIKTSSIFLSITAISLSVLCLGVFLKIFVRYAPKRIKNFLVILHVIILETAGLIFIYLVSFLSFFKRPFNKHINKTPILFVHGYINFSSVWIFHLFRLKKKGYGPLFLINLGYPFASIETYAKKLKTEITKIKQKTHKKELIIIAHSMGGLISSYFASKYPNCVNIKAIITLGSPLRGTKIAKIGLGKCCRQMEIDSNFIKNLQSKFSENILYHIVTKKDQLVIPYTSGIINSEKKYIIDDLGHSALLFSIRVTKKIEYWLNELED